MKFFNKAVVYIGSGGLMGLCMLSAFASIPYQPVVQINPYGDCVGFININQHGQEVRTAVCPKNWEIYKQVYVGMRQNQ